MIVQKKIIWGLPKTGFRKGVGKYEGVVIHFTDNYRSTLEGEIKWMTANKKNAFVHAFVNDVKVVETASTLYKAWGAGTIANGRFLHIEICVAHTRVDFMETMDNLAGWVALQLFKNKLGVSIAKPNGSGTVWTHSQVTKWLGGTTHVDPDAYWKKWGYSYGVFLKLVASKYATLGT